MCIRDRTDTPIKLDQIPDEKFYELVPNPTATGNPRYYRIWETEGVSTRLSTADTIDVVSSSASDAGSEDYTITVQGKVSGIWTEETYQLNGTTKVSGSNTFDADEIYVSKKKDTNGTVTVTAGTTTLVVLGKHDRNPRFKVMSFYPIPTSNTIYLEYRSRIMPLINESDVPNFNTNWHFVVVQGTLAKLYMTYLKDPTLGVAHYEMYKNSLLAMIDADRTNPDLVRHLNPSRVRTPTIHLHLSEDVIA